jgi:uncharacterized protein
MDQINRIFELHDLAVAEAIKYSKHRYIYETISTDKGKHILGITGLRGVGKSVILKQLAATTPASIYISLDTLKDVDIFGLVKQLNEAYKIKVFLLDEVHFIKNIDEALKQIYDFLDVKVIFTSSVALGMFKSVYDLSRRIKLLSLYPFSFREFLFFKNNINLPPLTIEAIESKKWTREYLRCGYHFEQYLKGGNMPFSLEEPDILSLLRNILHTVIHKDIPNIAKLTIDELDIITKLVTFIGKSAIDGINYSTIAKNIGITKFKAQSYIETLRQAYILQRIMPAGTNVLKEPKIVLALPFRLLFCNYDDCIGGLREDFFIEMLTMADFDFQYLKSVRGTKTPDYLLKTTTGSLIVEIGGHGKGREQFKGISGKKQIIFTHSNRIDGIRVPLFLAGMIK